MILAIGKGWNGMSVFEKYAEEASAVCEEMKYDIEQVIKEMVEFHGKFDQRDPELFIATNMMLGMVKGRLSKHLDKD